MTASLTVQIDTDTILKMCKYLRIWSRFAATVALHARPDRQEMDLTAVNENASCFASLKLSANLLQFQKAALAEMQQELTTGCGLPLKPLYKFLKKQATSSEGSKPDSVHWLRFDFTPVAVMIRDVAVDAGGGYCCWRCPFEAVPARYPLHQRPEDFACEIVGLGQEWFEALSATLASSRVSSELILTALPSRGLNLSLVSGSLASEVLIPDFAFHKFRCPDAREVGLVVGLREFTALMSLASSFGTFLSLFFSTGGEPMLATLPSIEGFDCKFILATLSLTQYQSIAAAKTKSARNATKTLSEREEVISATDSEDM